LQWLVVLPAELVASTFTFDYWNEKAMPSAAFVTIFLTLITIINLFGVLGYAEVEYVLGIFKVAAVIGFMSVPKL
jgi:yeast amino acid transporter